MRRTLTLLSVLVVLGTTATAAVASSVHLKGGAKAEPSFNDQGLVLNALGALSGLGNEDVLITVTATALPTATCGNPGRNTFQAPGQNPAEVEVSGSQSIPASQIKNGNTSFALRTEPPVSPIPGAPDCPNSSWTEIISDLAFTSAVITVEQPVGNLVLTVTCTFSSRTSDGLVPSGNVSCSQS